MSPRYFKNHPFEKADCMRLILICTFAAFGACTDQPPRSTEICTSIARISQGAKLAIGTSYTTRSTKENPVETIGRGGSLIVFDSIAGKSEKKIEIGLSIYRIAVSPNGHLIAVNEGNESFSLWDVNLEKKTGPINAHGAVNDMTFSPDSTLLSVATTNPEDLTKGGIIIYDVKTKKIDRLELGGKNELGSRSLCYSIDGKSLYCGFSKGIKVWDVVNKKWAKTLDHGMSCSIAVSSDGRFVASSSLERSVRIWNTATGEVQMTIDEFKKPATKILFSPTQPILCSLVLDDTLMLHDVKAKKLISSNAARTVIHDFVFSPGGEGLLLTKRKGLESWEYASGRRTDLSVP